MMDPTNDLLEMVDRLEGGIHQKSQGDAIDAILAGTSRTTQATSLRDHEIIQRFRREMIDGLIRVDTVRQLLGLVRTLVEAAIKP